MPANDFPGYVRHHEAGHAVVGWVLGERVYAIHLRTLADARAGRRIIIDRQGRQCMHHGLTEMSRRVQPHMARGMVDSGWKLSRHDLLAEFAVLLAGSYAEARQKHTAAVDVMLGGGADDHRQALEVADLLPVERPELIDAGHRMADTFVREYWPAIRAVADLLQGQESTAGDAVHELLDRGAGVRWPMPKGRNYMPD